MNTNTTLLLFLFFFSTLFYNCSPVPITKVDLTENDIGYWRKGSAIGEKITDDLIIEAAYSHQDKKYIYFDVAFENTGRERILIDPKTFQLIDLQSEGLLKAIDPELRIISMEVKQARRDANNKTFAIIAGAALVTGTVIAATSSDGDTGSSSSNNNEDDCENYYTESLILTQQNTPTPLPLDYPYFSEGPLLSTNLGTIPDVKSLDFWTDFTFRKSTLFPNQRMRGLVVFLKNKASKKTRLIFPIHSQEITFDFVHRTY